MTNIAFYHLEISSLEQALLKLLEKTLDAGKRALVIAGSEERVEALNTLLWTYDGGSWIPHGSSMDGTPEEQPVWLSIEEANLNNAHFLFLTDGIESATVSNFERCFDLFDGNDPIMLQAARERWRISSDAGHQLTYWKQGIMGDWEKRAEVHN
ncbi:MAG: DNA polymerase III subunit chi [Rhodospirillaceae bacterium TMED8]|nr:DNA polymerase III subunit chi [Magnetovibrio sp.]OUT50863.1 MAG: DNA polymerase III subunit chi [Rhodospirillaceae bacterium TMED8]|tara:strand:+ start:43 stop:504 length:462 start_codon:yes stop_codon:yes gene_type:complete